MQGAFLYAHLLLLSWWHKVDLQAAACAWEAEVRAEQTCELPAVGAHCGEETARQRAGPAAAAEGSPCSASLQPSPCQPASPAVVAVTVTLAHSP